MIYSCDSTKHYHQLKNLKKLKNKSPHQDFVLALHSSLGWIDQNLPVQNVQEIAVFAFQFLLLVKKWRNIIVDYNRFNEVSN